MFVESSLLEKIRARKATLTFLGLGHVGLPTAVIFARAGFRVTGIDTDSQKVRDLARGKCDIREPGLEETLVICLRNGSLRFGCSSSDVINKSDIVSICVPTPVENTKPDMRNFQAAFDAVKRNAHMGMMILIESTVPPSTTSRLVAPELRSLGYKIDEDILLAYCPERLSPSRALEEFASNTRIIGGIGQNSRRVAAELYKTVCRDVEVTDTLTAELAKVAENTFRDLNIAYANLLALIAESLGADVNEVIRLANTHPRVAIHKPGLGVGGPCLPKDPYMLIQGASEDLGQMVKLARRLNDEMVIHAISLLAQTLTDRGFSIKGAKVAVLGVAYKPDTEDVTNSPAKLLIQELLKRGAFVAVYDPCCAETFGAERASSAHEALKDRDCLIIATAHTNSVSVDLLAQSAKPGCVIFDGPRCLDPERVKRIGLTYLGTGYGTGERSREKGHSPGS